MKQLIPLFFLATLVSCGKSDTTPPVITVVTPSDNQVFTNGQTVTVKADLSDDHGIHEIMLTVLDNTGGHVLHFDEHYDGKTYSLNKTFTVQSGKTYTIEIESTDHNENTGTKTLTVSAN